jgi:predicted dehydrogenase
MLNEVIRLGLVGVGRWGRNYVRTIAGIDNVELACAASRNPETTALVPPDCRIVEDWRSLVASTDIEGVIVATPPATHAEILIASVEAGKSVLVEKPLAVARSELSAIEHACARAPCTIMVEHTHLFHPAFRALKSEVANLGFPRAIRSSAGARGPYRRDASVLWDWASHDLAMALDLVPGPAEVRQARVIERQYIDGVAADRVHLELDLAQGISCDITVSTLDERHRWFAADFKDRTLMYMDRGEHPLRLFRAPGARPTQEGESLAVAAGLPLTIAVREFAAAVRERQPMRKSLLLGCQVVDLLLRCEEKIKNA